MLPLTGQGCGVLHSSGDGYSCLSGASKENENDRCFGRGAGGEKRK